MNWKWILLTIAGYYIFKSGAVTVPGVPASGGESSAPSQPSVPGPSTSVISHREAALIVARNRPDICRYLSQEIHQQWNCNSEDATVEAIAHWFYEMEPPEAMEYRDLIELVIAKGWR